MVQDNDRFPESGPDGEGPGRDHVGPTGIVVSAILAVVVAVVALYTLWSFWPSQTGNAQDPVSAASRDQHISYFGLRMVLDRETAFFVIVCAGGVIGGMLHAVRSLGWYIGNRSLRRSWIFFTAMMPIVGALGATVFYLILRAGLFSPSTSAAQASPFGFAAVAVLVGIFSEEAMEKLRDLAENVFTKRGHGSDHVAATTKGDGPGHGK